MRVTTALNRMLGLPGASVRDVEFSERAVIVTVVLRAKKPVCSGCGARGLPVKEHRTKPWRHLDQGGLRCRIECRLRRLYCPGCGDVYEMVPWARAGPRARQHRLGHRGPQVAISQQNPASSRATATATMPLGFLRASLSCRQRAFSLRCARQAMLMTSGGWSRWRRSSGSLTPG